VPKVSKILTPPYHCDGAWNVNVVFVKYGLPSRTRLQFATIEDARQCDKGYEFWLFEPLDNDEKEE
jgi:hypothetical protein